MIRRLAVAAMLLAGCATPAPRTQIGQSLRSFEGLPFYLSSAWTRAHPQPGEPPPGRRLAAAERGGSDVMVRGSETTAPSQAQAAPSQAQAAPSPAEQPTLTQADRLLRIRALLAAINAHLVAIDARGGRTPTVEQQRALALTIEDLGEMLEAFPDVVPEGDELRGLVERLPDTPPGRMPPMLRRMQDLTDLILLQIFVGR